MSKGTARRRRPSAQGQPNGGSRIGRVGGSAKVTQVGRDQINFNLCSPSAHPAGEVLRGATPIWNIPSPIRSFTGRESDLAEIHSTLVSGGATALVPATTLHGTGGVGKSQLALAYAESHKAEYRLGWWVPAETELEIITGLARLAKQLGFVGEPRDLAAAVLRTLSDEDSWLLIFDNATPETLAPLLPSRGRGAILITSRSPAWQGVATGVRVDVLPRGDAVTLLLSRCGQTDRSAADELATELGCLPLALVQAASYLAGPPPLQLREYLSLFRERRAELLAKGAPVAYGGTVDSTFSLAIERLDRISPVAVRLLELFAFLAPEGIPAGMFDNLVVIRKGTVVDPLAFRESLVRLLEAGLLSEEAGGLMRMHRLVQDVVRAHLSDAVRHTRLQIDIELLTRLTPNPEDPANWPTVNLLFPHACVALAHARREGLANLAVIALATNTGMVVTALGLGIEVAIDLDGYAVELARGLRPQNDRAVAWTLNNLGKDLSLAGDLGGAWTVLEESLKLRRRLHPGDHPEVAEAADNLAGVARELGETALARELHDETLAMRRRLYSGDHALLAHSIGNLGTDLSESGESALRTQMHRDALEMLGRLIKGDHPDIATGMANLGNDLALSGDIDGARKLLEEALAMRKRLFLGDHWAIAQSLMNLSFVLKADEVDRAFELDQEATAMFRRLHRGDHPDIAKSLHNLAADLEKLGRVQEAQQYEDEANAMWARLRESQGRHPAPQ